ncbi:MAG: GAF domain-containing protein [Candidatus Bathyarchaeia archaeon]
MIFRRSSLRKYWPTLYEVTKACASAMNIPAILNLVVREVTEAMNIKASSIHLLDPKEKSLELAAAYGLSDDFLKKVSIFLEKSPFDQEALQGKPITLREAFKEPRIPYRDALEKEGIASMVIVPLMVRDKAIGILKAYTSVPRNFSPAELEFLIALADISAATIENARLNQSLQKRCNDLNTLLNVVKAIASSFGTPDVLNVIAKSAVEVLGVKACSIRLYDEKTGLLNLAAAYGLSDEYLKKGPVTIEKSLIDKEALQGKPIAIPDFASDPRVQYREEARKEGIASVLCVPLPFKDKMIGTIRVYTSLPHEFTEEELSLLTMFAAHAAIVIQNTKLYQMVLRNWQKLVDEVLEKWPILTG